MGECLGDVFDSLWWNLTCKQEQKLGKLSVITQVIQSSKFHYVYQDMTTGLLINIQCLSILVTQESRVNFDRISPYLVQASFKESGEMGLNKYT